MYADGNLFLTLTPILTLTLTCVYADEDVFLALTPSPTLAPTLTLALTLYADEDTFFMFQTMLLLCWVLPQLADRTRTMSLALISRRGRSRSGLDETH